MGEKGLKWCDIFLALFGAILSFGDPTTDILIKTRPAVSNGFSHERSVLAFIHSVQPW